MSSDHYTDVAIIGAGPSGSIAAALLRQRGWDVAVLERGHFPRFTIGESLLPQCMAFLEAAGMMEAVRDAGFQIKRGVTFAEGDKRGVYRFDEQFTPGWGWTWQVQRARFDDILARQAERQGASLRFGEGVESVDFSDTARPRLHVRREDGSSYALDARFVCDASGAGRVLPRMLGLERPVNFPERAAIFTHVADGIQDPAFEREHIRIGVHPEHADIWYWMIPFAGGRMSIGVVGRVEALGLPADDPGERLRALVGEEPGMAELLAEAEFDTPVRSIRSYAVSVERLHGEGYALLGNAGEFLDPVFSSGVTLGMGAAVRAAEQIDLQLRGEVCDWEGGFEQPLRDGLAVFRSFVETWYSGALRHVFFEPEQSESIRRMISSVLGGYVWDHSNPFVARPERRLQALCQACAP